MEERRRSNRSPIFPLPALMFASAPSENVLRLLAHAADRGLHDDDELRELGVGALGADGVRLARHLLEEEVEGLAGVAASVEERLRLIEVAREAGDLLRDVGAIGEQGD